MITPAVADELKRVIDAAEASIRRRMREGLLRQEPDITSRLMEGIAVRSEELEGISITLETIDGLGRNAAENVVGADILGALHVDVAGARISKGFLMQAKLSGRDRLRFRPASTDAAGVLDASHVFSRGPLTPVEPDPTYQMGSTSGTVTITRPSKRLNKQYKDMLRLTPASFVLVLDPDQVAIVGASAVRAHRHAEPRVQHDLATKSLTDFFSNVADCFLGDERLGASTQAELVALASVLNVPAALSVRIVGQPVEG